MEGQAAVEVVGQLYVHCVVGGGVFVAKEELLSLSRRRRENW